MCSPGFFYFIQVASEDEKSAHACALSLSYEDVDQKALGEI